MLSWLKLAVIYALAVFVTFDGAQGQYRNKSKSCVLPEHPKNGRWTISRSSFNPEPGQEVISGTVIYVTCNNYYEHLGQAMSKCTNGKWSLRIEELSCGPKCGVKPKSSENTKQYYPWNVAIYKTEGEKKVFQCAGTLLGERTIVTAAHCLSDSLGQKLSPNLYKVAAGISSASYEDPQDPEAQYSDVEDMFLSENFEGASGKYKGDVGMILTKTIFNMTDRIQLACYDWNNNFLNEIDYQKVKGYIAGPLKSPYFPELNEVFEMEVPFVNDTQCVKMLKGDDPARPSFEDYYTKDKICAGYINSDKVPMCRVDPGVGLVVKNQHDDKYYVTGVLSLTNSVFFHSNSCDNQRWVLFTRLSEVLK